MLAPLLLFAIAGTPAPADQPAQPLPSQEPVTITLPDSTHDIPEIIPPFGDTPAAHDQARAASKIVLETAREASAVSDTKDDAEADAEADEQEPKVP